MEDENGLELGLSLAWCQSSSKSQIIGDNSSDTREEEGDRSSKLINDFKHFLEGGTRKLESKPEERGLWMSNDNKGLKVEEEKGPETSNKRKNFFEDISNQKKRERESHNFDLPERSRQSHNFDLPERSRQSHISINTDDGSTAENEDVADSEAMGSTSRTVSRHENSGNKYFETGKEVYTVFDTSAVDVPGQRGFTITPEKELRGGKVPYSVTFPLQPANILNMPHPVSAKDGSVSATFGYSPVQLPVLDKDNSRGMISHLQQLLPSYHGRFPSSTDNVSSQVSQVMQMSSDALQYSGTVLEHTNNEGKLNVRDSGSKIEPNKLPSELSSITPGIASDLKFGGCGSYPNLPWVSTKGSGPNGRTISGVTYRYSSSQIKIVCACHGSHMSPEEFVRHANEEKSGPGSGSGLASLPSNNNPAASAQS